MAYRRFSVRVTLRLVALLANLVTLAFIFARTELFFSQLILLLFLLFQVYDLVQLVTQTNRDLARFLLALRQSDYSVSFRDPAPTDPSFGSLHASFDEIIDAYKKLEARQESQFLFFKLIIEGVNVGIISLSGENKLVVVNKAAENLLKLPGVPSWSQVQSRQPAFAEAVRLAGGGRRLVEMRDAEETRQLSVGVDTVLLLGEPYRIITFQDIRSEIEQKEIEAWHTLIRVLTHEITNSVTPLVSLTETMRMILEEEGHPKKPSAVTEENIADLHFSLRTIQKRSDGMLHFIRDYRKLTKIPVPRLEAVKIGELLASAGRLMRGEMHRREVKLFTRLTDPELTVQADFQLVEQVLINLITNSLQALEGVPAPVIELSAYTRDDHLIIEVTDNGKGIDRDKLEQIFVPFYSTREEGSGIGLSLSRQIMKLHQGTLRVRSEKGIKTSFQLQFRVRHHHSAMGEEAKMA
ncbi:MAG: GHKL domain-containing protein [Ferruginibacter sp.]|nr:GHKL domain-containing protein [Cytophagales bacterium]